MFCILYKFHKSYCVFVVMFVKVVILGFSYFIYIYILYILYILYISWVQYKVVCIIYCIHSLRELYSQFDLFTKKTHNTRNTSRHYLNPPKRVLIGTDGRGGNLPIRRPLRSGGLNQKLKTRKYFLNWKCNQLATLGNATNGSQ